jgi:hypothetical protein
MPTVPAALRHNENVTRLPSRRLRLAEVFTADGRQAEVALARRAARHLLSAVAFTMPSCRRC